MLQVQDVLKYIVGVCGILVGAGSLLIRYVVLVVSAVGIDAGVNQDTLTALPTLDTWWAILMAGLAVFGYVQVKVAEMAQAERQIQETARMANLSVGSDSDSTQRLDPR